MGKHTQLGWSKSSDEIPQPISILMGANLRKNSEEDIAKQKPERQKPKPKKPPLKK